METLKTEEIKEKCDQFLKSNATCDKTVKKCIADVIRAVDLADSKRDIIVCIGILKSGKSTLVNLLARNEKTSPTEMGTDKTLRPALIRMVGPDEEACVRIYYSTTSTEDTREELFKALINNLCGIQGKLPKAIEEKLENFEPDVLQEVLCRKQNETKYLEKEPLLVVIDLEYNKESLFFHNRERMLMDMPGCDSGHAESTKDGTYTKIGEECAMALLLQSTSQPLNKEAIYRLRELFDGRNENTVRIIQNRFDNKPWRELDVVKKENSEQSEKAAKEIRDIYPGSKLSTRVVNLGMATDGLFTPPEKIQERCELYGKEYKGKDDLWRASGFTEMEQELVNNLADIRNIHCKDRLKKAINELTKTSANLIQSKEEEIKQNREKRQKWKALCANAKQQLLNGIKKQFDNMSVKMEPSMDAGSFSQLCDKEWRVRITKRGEGNPVKGSLIDTAMKECNEKCSAKCRAHLFGEKKLRDISINDTPGYEVLREKLRTVIERVKAQLEEQHSHVWKELKEAEKMNEWEINKNETFRVALPQEMDNFDYVIKKTWECHQCVNILFPLTLWEKKFTVDETLPLFQKPVIDKMAKHYEKNCTEYLQKESILESLQNTLKAQAESVANDFCERIHDKHIKALEEKIKNLEEEKKQLESAKTLIPPVN